MIITTIAGSSIEVIPISEGRGFVTIRTGRVELINNYKTFIHAVNLSDYEEAFESLTVSATHLPGTIPEAIKLLLNKANQELQIFRTREKRGLANILGKGIKFITGNLDADDAIEINERLRSLEENEENVVQFDNKLVHFSSHMDSELTRITDHINNQTALINEQIDNFSRSLHSLEDKLQIKTIEDAIILNIQLFLNHLMSLKQAILFSKLGLLSADLLDPSEIANIDIGHYQYIKTALFRNIDKKLLYFIVKIPIFSNVKYYNTIIEPIPNFNGTQLYPNSDNLILNSETNVLYVKDSIEESKLSKPSDCISHLLTNTKINCTFMQSHKPSITQLTENIIITKNLNKTALSHNCEQNQNIVIIGNNLIRFSNCNIILNNHTYSSVKKAYYEHILLPYVNENINSSVTPEITLESLNIKHLEQMKELSIIKVSHKSIIAGFSSIILIIIISVIVSLYISFKIYEKTHQTNAAVIHIRTDNNPTPVCPEPNACKGGVIATATTPTPYLNPFSRDA